MLSKRNNSMGLAALGASGDWNVAVDQSTSGPERWHMQIDGRAILVECWLSGPKVIEQLNAFLGSASQPSRDSEFQINDDVVVVRDDEYRDRIFIHITGKCGALVHACIAGDELKSLSEAVSQAHAELAGDRALT